MNRRILYPVSAALVAGLAGALFYREPNQNTQSLPTPILIEERVDKNPVSGEETSANPKLETEYPATITDCNLLKGYLRKIKEIATSEPNRVYGYDSDYILCGGYEFVLDEEKITVDIIGLDDNNYVHLRFYRPELEFTRSIIIDTRIGCEFKVEEDFKITSPNIYGLELDHFHENRFYFEIDRDGKKEFSPPRRSDSVVSFARTLGFGNAPEPEVRALGFGTVLEPELIILRQLTADIDHITQQDIEDVLPEFLDINKKFNERLLAYINNRKKITSLCQQ